MADYDRHVVQALVMHRGSGYSAHVDNAGKVVVSNGTSTIAVGVWSGWYVRYPKALKVDWRVLDKMDAALQKAVKKKATELLGKDMDERRDSGGGASTLFASLGLSSEEE
jgi:hypothetical protein